MDKEPFGIGGFLPWDKVYSYEPLEGLDTTVSRSTSSVCRPTFGLNMSPLRSIWSTCFYLV